MKYHAKYFRHRDAFAENLYNRLVENFPQTYLVGGYVRDLFLHKNNPDIDIATGATPKNIISLLNRERITFNDSGIRFGVIRVLHKNISVEIATFRKEKYGTNRYPAIAYTKSLRADAKRRDFTVNALYLQAKTKKLIDYFGGQGDIKNRIIRFIGGPEEKIKEDPLRIVRALRFCLQLNFRMEKKAWRGILNNFSLAQTLTRKKIDSEIHKAGNVKNILLLKQLLYCGKRLDNVSKKFYYNDK